MVEVTKVTDRKFGIEIEFQGNADQLVTNLNNAGISAQREGYNHITRRHWKIVSDASCGWEVVSPILQGEDGLYQLETVCETMSNSDVTTTRRTGVHVHLDAADLTTTDITQVVKRYQENEEELDTWFPSSRRGSSNTYCRRLDDCMRVTEMNTFTDATTKSTVARNQRNRFCKLNLHSLMNHGTIEFRQHAGSTDFNKIGNWVLFLQHFVEQSRKTKNSGGIDPNYRPRKKAPFAEIRDQVQMFGATLKYAGNIEGGSRWKLTKQDGQVFVFTNTELDELYVDEGRVQGRRELKTEAAARIAAMIGVGSAIDSSLTADVPASVIEFFNQRAADLAA
tara:strand:- start:83 stop:1093 length:1011 start_codon:yes stop_codon:yes gene_type:complete